MNNGINRFTATRSNTKSTTMDNLQRYLVTGFNEYFDEIGFDRELSNYISKETGKAVLAFTACDYGVGIYIDEESGFGAYGTDIDLGETFISFLDTNREAVDTILNIPDDIEGYIRASILILCAFLAYYEESISNPLWGKEA